MNKLEFYRRKRGLSQRGLGLIAKVDASYICNAESRGFRLYERQMRELANALDWNGDPYALLDEAEISDNVQACG